MPARQTAEAQIAVAEAALVLAMKSGGRESFNLAVGLTTNLMTGFRPRARTGASATLEPRGLTSLESHPVRTVLGFKLWPDPARYSVWANARAYLLLRRLSSASLWPAGANPARGFLVQALSEQEAWLRKYPR